MISTKTLLRCLTVLISVDIVLTILSVGYMGATELNVIASMVGFSGFMALKIMVSVVAVYAIYRCCIPSAPFITRYGILLLGMVYMAFCASNAYQLVGAAA